MMKKKTEKSFCTFLSEAPGEKFSAGFYRINIPNYAGKTEVNPYFAMTYVIEGEGTFTDFHQREYKLKPGCLMLRHPDQPRILKRRSVTPDGWFEFSCAIPNSFYQALANIRILNPDETLLEPGLDESILILAERLIRLLPESDEDAGRSRAMGCFLELLAQIKELSGSQVNAKKHFQTEIDRLIGNRFGELSDLRPIAKELNMEYETFRKKFVSETGTSPQNYLIAKRLEHANTLLIYSEDSLKEIAAKLGYADAACFSRQYHKFFGYPPSQTRRRQ